MTPSKKSKKLKKADVLALLNPPTTKPELDVPETPSSPIPGPDTPNILSSGRLTKDQIKKLEDRSIKLIKKRKRLEADIDAERQLLSGGRPAPAASPVWSKNMEALQGRLERLSAKETKHMAELTTKFSLVTGEYMPKETSKKRRAMETMGKIYERFHDHLGQHGVDTSSNLKSENKSAEITKQEEASDGDDTMDVEGLENDNEDGNAKISVQEQFERATRHMNLDEYDETEIPSDIEETITRSASKGAMNPLMRGFTPLNPSFMPFHSHSTADHGFNFGVEDGEDPFLDEEKTVSTKSKKDGKKEKKKRKRENVPDETAAEQSADEQETPKKKKNKGKKVETEIKQDLEDTEHEDSDNEDLPKKAKKEKRSKMEQDSAVWPPNRRYSTSIIPLPIVPPHGFVSPARPVAQASPTSKHSASSTGPPVPIAPPVAPNSGRRRSMGAWSVPKKRMFSSIRDSPPPIMGGATTPEPKKQWVLEGGTAKSTSKAAGTVTMTIGAHPPVRSTRDASPAEAASQKRRPGRPKGSKTQNRKAIIAGEPPLVSTTPIPLPVYASRAHNEDLVRMMVPDVEGKPVFANSPIRGSMSLEDRLQQDRAMYAEERARWFEAIGMADPAAQGASYHM